MNVNILSLAGWFVLLCLALLFLGLLTVGAILIIRHFQRKKQSEPPPLSPKPAPSAAIPPQKCPQCRQPLPMDAPEGLCPQCLAKVALGSEPAATGATININPLAEAAPGTRVAPDPAQLAAQFPQLEIIELLGMGGMGIVYKARQPRLDRLVALKILPVESQQHRSFAERFGREAKALAKLNHPGIVNIHDFGQTSQYFYFVMEYVDGMNLRHLLHNQPLEPRQALELVTQICTALQYAHDEGVVHRDIKPENILLNKRGQAKIADFGLAKLLGNAPDTALTMSQASMGTLNYMAPEQRENAQKVDHRADIFSLGVVFYEMLTGELPLGRFAPPSQKVHVDVRLDEVVLKSLEKEPDRRYQHASEVKTGIEGLRVPTPQAPESPPIIPGAPVALPQVAPKTSRKGLIGASLVILGIALTVGGGNASSMAGQAAGPLFLRTAFIVIAMLGLGGVAIGTILGWVAVGDARHAATPTRGLPMALFAALFLPILVVDLLLFFLAFDAVPKLANAYLHSEADAVSSAILDAWGLLILIGDFIVGRAIWRNASKHDRALLSGHHGASGGKSDDEASAQKQARP